MHTKFNSNPNKPNLNKRIISSKTEVNFERKNKTIELKEPTLEFAHLCYNVNDDYKTLISKNENLRNVLIHSSNRIEDLQQKINEMQEEHLKEKTLIFNELDRISQNYKEYAESHKKIQEMDVDYFQLKDDYTHNAKLLNAYHSNISEFLSDYVDLFKQILKHLTSFKQYSSSNLVYDMKDAILTNMIKYRNWIDNFNFAEIYDEYQDIVGKSTYYFKIKPTRGNSNEAHNKKRKENLESSNKHKTKELNQLDQTNKESSDIQDENETNRKNQFDSEDPHSINYKKENNPKRLENQYSNFKNIVSIPFTHHNHFKAQ